MEVTPTTRKRLKSAQNAPASRVVSIRYEKSADEMLDFSVSTRY
jgi:hypothetical protein